MTLTKSLSLSPTEEKVIELFINTLESKLPEATKIILFGSRARGSSNEESDLDIAIVVKDKVKKGLWEKLWEIKWETLERLLLEEFPLSLFPLTEEEMNLNTPIIEEIKKEGVILWQRS